MSEAVAILRLTRSQQMALIDIVGYHMRRPEEVQVFINCSTDPMVETTTGDLMKLLTECPDWEASTNTKLPRGGEHES